MKRLLIALIILFFAVLATPALAADYYVDCSIGGTGGAGSFADPFKSLEDFNGDISGWTDGDDLYFKQGTTCTYNASATHLDFTGVDGASDANRTIIGTYEAEGDFDPSGARVILDGDGTYPSANTGLLYKKDAAGATFYITVQDIQIIGMSTNSGARAIHFENDGSASGDYDVIIDNVKIDGEGAKTAGIGIFDNIKAEIKSSEITRITGDSANPGIVCKNSGADCWVHHNKFHQNSAEQMNLTQDADGLVEDNVFYDSGYLGVYIGHTGGTVVRNNLFYNVDGGTYNLRDSGSIGVFVGLEAWRACTTYNDNSVYGNIIIGMATGINSDDGRDCDPTNRNIFNNIINNCGYSFRFWNTDVGSGVVQNNISYNPSIAHVDNCPAGGLGYTWGYNKWSSDPGSGACDDSGSNDLAWGTPSLKETSTAYYDSLTAGQFMHQAGEDDICITEGADLIDSGNDLGSYILPICGAYWDGTTAGIDSTNGTNVGDPDDYGPPGQATLQAEPDAGDLNPTLETNAYVQPTAGAQSWPVGAVSGNNDHLYTIWRLAEGDGVGDECDPTPTWTWETKSYTDLLAHVFSGLSENTIYCWQAVFGNVAGDGTASAIDEFSTTGSSAGTKITTSSAGSKNVTITVSGAGSKTVTITIKP
jgi:hypothetical protein